jgi:hypothetical protein
LKVSKLKEGDEIKCHQYWPSTGSMNYGNFVVTLLEEESCRDYTIRTFSLSLSGQGNTTFFVNNALIKIHVIKAVTTVYQFYNLFLQIVPI